MICWLLWGLALGVRAQEVRIFNLDGQRYALPAREVKLESGPQLMVEVESKEAQNLIAQSGRRFSWSASGETLIVFSGQRYWTYSLGDGSLRTSEGQTLEAAGGASLAEGKRFLSPALFLQLLDLEPNLPASDLAESQGEVKLSHRVGAPQIEHTNQGQRLVWAIDSRPRWTSKIEGNRLELEFENTRWSEATPNMHIGHLRLETEAGGTEEAPSLKIKCALPAYWQPLLRSALDPKRLQVAVVPDFGSEPSAEPSQLKMIASQGGESLEESPVGAALESTLTQRSQLGEGLTLEGTNPFRYFWSYCPQCHKLVVDLDNVLFGEHIQAPRSREGQFEEAKLSQIGTADHPITRLELTVSPLTSFTFSEGEGEELCALWLAPELKSPQEAAQAEVALHGAGRTAGYVEERGIIVIDPGHGGGDPGCYSRHLGIYEKEITLDVAHRLRQILEADGWKVVMTRETDRDVSWLGSPDLVELQARCDVANAIQADYFISLHCNASTSSAPNGSSIYWYKPEDRDLARALEGCLNGLGFYQIGMLRDSFYILRHTDMPAVLVEMAYLTNYADGLKLADQNYRQNIAEELAQALSEYVASSASSLGRRQARRQR